MPRKNKPVIVTDPDGKEHIFSSSVAAAEYIGCPPGSVRNTINLNFRIYGYRVRYASDEKPENYPKEIEIQRCQFNRYINCADPGLCSSCGWNPDVKKKRAKRIKGDGYEEESEPTTPPGDPG